MMLTNEALTIDEFERPNVWVGKAHPKFDSKFDWNVKA